MRQNLQVVATWPNTRVFMTSLLLVELWHLSTQVCAIFQLKSVVSIGRLTASYVVFVTLERISI